jgi:hypothetical protein
VPRVEAILARREGVKLSQLQLPTCCLMGK